MYRYTRIVLTKSFDRSFEGAHIIVDEFTNRLTVIYYFIFHSEHT